MSSKKNIIFGIISAVLGFGALIFIVIYKNLIVGDSFIVPALVIFAGSLVSMFLITLFHELGHLVFGLLNGFKFISMTVWCFKWEKSGANIKFSFVKFPEAAGVTEMVPKHAENLKSRYIKLSMGGIVFNFILLIIGVLPLVLSGLSNLLACFLCPLSPLSLYLICDSLLPTDKGGIRNDGGVVLGLKKQDNDSKVLLNILKIHSELYLGKSYSEIDESYYFDLPQLCEEHPYFIQLLTLRYSYYLDKCDYDNAKKILSRLLSLIEIMPSDVYNQILTEELYSVCTFDFNEKRADELMYELEKYLNNNNNVGSVRTKLSYLVYILKEYDNFEMFYNKGIRESKRLQVKGQGKFEISLFENIKHDFDGRINE